MYPTRHALLRDRRSWQTPAWPTALLGLVADDDGYLTLQRLPRPSPPIELPAPFDVPPSGLAAAPCMGLFIADAQHDQVIFRDDFCCDEARVGPVPCACADGAGFAEPRGLAYGAHGLFVADSAHARVLRFRVETLRLQGSLHAGIGTPQAVAVDAKGRVHVLDAASESIHRFEATGTPDSAYATALSTQLVKPRFMALASNGVLWVSDASGDAVRRFDADGAAIASLPAARPGWMPRAIALAGARAYVADAQSGLIFAYDGDACLGAIPDFRGPVSALAAGDDGALYIKTGQDEHVLVACAGMGVVARGELRAGPIDAGERSDWDRVALDVRLPAGAEVELAVFFVDTAAPEPADAEWIVAPATDVLLSTIASNMTVGAGSGRYLWLRVRLRASANGDSPRLQQVHAATSDEDYRQWLPSVFAEQDGDGVLKRLLALARSEIGGAEGLIADLPRLASPDFIGSADLPWLAEWLDFELPTDFSASAKREALRDAFKLVRKRGTVAGLLAWIHLQTGVRAQLVEWAGHRRIWQLGATSALGFDTALPGASADGITVADPCLLDDTDPRWGCHAPERIVVGHSVVGLDGPVLREDFGSPLFEDHGHRMTLLVPFGQAPERAMRERLRAVVDAEKPAHVSCDVCFVEPRMRVGMAARIGLDAVVAGNDEPLRLEQGALGQDTRLGGTPPPTGTVGQNARIGSGLALG